MNKVPKISVIIPVYNAASNLEQCIRSVLGQTFPDFEIIAVDDGSTDKSPEVLQAIAAGDRRLQVYHTSNRGVSAARNFGIDRANGSYIGFVDSDDWAEPQMFEKLYKAISTNDCDWALCNVMVREASHCQTRLILQNGYIDLADKRPTYIQQFMQFKFDYANWNKLFKASVIRQRKIRFEEKLFLWEDLLFNLQYLYAVNRIAVLEQPLYNYRVQPTSLCNRHKENRLAQFNLLFRTYEAWSLKTGNSEEAEAFRKEMARLTYNQELNEAETRAKERSYGFISLWREYAVELQGFDSGLFQFQSVERNGWQGFKKGLLTNGKFFLFAMLVACKISFRKRLKRLFRNR